jgi:hypothetical protein
LEGGIHLRDFAPRVRDDNSHAGLFVNRAESLLAFQKRFLNRTVAENTNVAASASEWTDDPLAGARGYTFSETAEAGTIEEGRWRPMIARQRASSAGYRSIRDGATRIIRDCLDPA